MSKNNINTLLLVQESITRKRGGPGTAGGQARQTGTGGTRRGSLAAACCSDRRVSQGALGGHGCCTAGQSGVPGGHGCCTTGQSGVTGGHGCCTAVQSGVPGGHGCCTAGQSGGAGDLTASGNSSLSYSGSNVPSPGTFTSTKFDIWWYKKKLLLSRVHR